MIEHHLDIPTAEGSMNTFITYPEEGGPFPVVFFYMDAPGKREELHDMARRLATVGYFVVLPNLYYRRAREFSHPFDADGIEKMLAMMRTLTNELVLQDTLAMINFVDDHANADARRIGAVGYCMSGPFVLCAAGRYPNRIKCAASIYGANLVTDRDDSAHLMADKATGELYIACAEIDEYAPREIIAELESHLRGADTNYRLEWYPGAHHGFAFLDRAGAFHMPSAERHWERLFALFNRNLVAED